MIILLDSPKVMIERDDLNNETKVSSFPECLSRFTNVYAKLYESPNFVKFHLELMTR